MTPVHVPTNLTPAQNYPAPLCDVGKFQLLGTSLSPHVTPVCSNGLGMLFAKCFEPVIVNADQSINAACVARKTPVQGFAANGMDGRAYNLVAKAPGGAWLRDEQGYSVVFASYRIHATNSLTATTCENGDSNSQIACLTQADPCSVSYAAPPAGKSQSDSTHPTHAGNGDSFMTYSGGPVLDHVKVVAVFWNSNVDATVRAQIGSFYQAFTNSRYMDWLREYDTPTQSIGRGSFRGAFTLTPVNTCSALQDSDVADELALQINRRNIPAPDANTLYMVHFPPGVSITQEGEVSCTDFCGYHGDATRSLFNTNQTFAYAVLPHFGPPGTCTCGNRTPFQNLTKTASHELSEAVTDPVVFTGWNGPLGEIGDPCNYATLGSDAYGSLTASDGTVYSVQKEFSHSESDCVTTLPQNSDLINLTYDFFDSGAWVVAQSNADAQGTFRISTQSADANGYASAAVLGFANPVGSIVADFNGDNITDVGAVIPDGFAIGFGSTSGQIDFVNKAAEPVPTWTKAADTALIGDFDADGKTDLAFIAIHRPDQDPPPGFPVPPALAVAFSKGDGTFRTTSAAADATFMSHATDEAYRRLAGDFDGDGKTDIAVLPGHDALAPFYFAVAYSRGDGTFVVKDLTASMGDFSLWASEATGGYVGDFDNDGQSDIVLLGGQGWGSVPVAFASVGDTFDVHNVFLGDFGTWAAQLSGSAFIGDVDGNGKDDIILVGLSGQDLAVGLSNGRGGFSVARQTLATFVSLAQISQIVIGDFDRDGKADIALPSLTSPVTIPVAFSNGDGTFRTTDSPVSAAWLGAGGSLTCQAASVH